MLNGLHYHAEFEPRSVKKIYTLSLNSTKNDVIYRIFVAFLLDFVSASFNISKKSTCEKHRPVDRWTVNQH